MTKIKDKTAFVKFESFFNNPIDRNITYLSDIYDDTKLLKQKIRIISQGVLDNNTLISGKKILLKPNWVTHNNKKSDEFCLRTHDNIVLSLIEIIIENKPAKITIGDAPIQGCHWNEMRSQAFYHKIEELSTKYKVPIIVKDFRRTTFNPEINQPLRGRNPITNYVILDLKNKSNLDPISSPHHKFRVTSYDPSKLAETHKEGKHQYCITNELFDADLIISMPKIKTHQKTGITGALKNLVGINGDKDYLPHHRVGGVKDGGDCYPGRNILRRAAEYFSDNANKSQGKDIYRFWSVLTKIMWKLSIPKKTHQFAAGWYGNDTCWRMVMDLNTIAIFGKKDGTISKDPQRMLYSLTDGIIGGQGDGPLNPEPLPLGIICFSNNSYLTDICMGRMMGFDIKKIPLLKAAQNTINSNNFELSFNGLTISMEELIKYSIITKPSPGWEDYLK